MELTDLHRHLDGSLRAATLEGLAAERGVRIPEDLGFERGMGLERALAQFAITLSVLGDPSAVERVASEICEDAAAEGVSVLEIRFAPQLHRGASIDRIVDAALSGIGGRAGLLLCGLYGEPPAVLMQLVEVARTRPGVVGIDLAGGPSPDASFGLADYAAPFERARAIDLGRTVHAAEGRPAEEIRVAIEQLFAQRIGHGTTLLDDPAIVDLVLSRHVTIEACPTSNMHTGAIPSIDAHPLPRWLSLGIPACINTDNTLLSKVDAPTEYQRARAIDGMTDARLDAAIAHGRHAAFPRRG